MIKFANDWSSLIQDATVGTGATTITIQSADVTDLGTIDSGDHYVATASNGTSKEIMHITGASGSQIIVERAKEGTTALEFASGDIIEICNTAGMYDEFVQTEELGSSSSIADNAVTNAKLADMTANRLKGRVGTDGDPQDLTSAEVKSFLGMGDDDWVTNGNLADMAAETIKGRKEATSGDPQDLTVAELKTLLGNDWVSNTTLSNMAAETIKGRKESTSGDPQDLTVAELKTLLGIDRGYIWLSGKGIEPRSSNGCSDPSGGTAGFPDASDSSGYWYFALPKDYISGDIKVEAVHWTASAGTAGDDVEFEISAAAYGDDDAMGATLGTAVAVTDDLIAADDLHIASSGSTLTPSGTVAAGCMIEIECKRDVSSGASPLAQTVDLIGIQISYPK